MPCYPTERPRQLVNATVDSVRLKKRLPCNAVLDVIGVDWMRYTALGVLGLDEIALKKGHRGPVVIVMARLHED